jgi:hypothetical protein
MGRLTNIAVLVGVLAIAAAPALADIGFRFDYTGLELSYTAAAGPGGKVGTLSLYGADYVRLDKIDLGGDGFGGGNDTLLDDADISGSANMGFGFSGTVYKLGTNSYQIVGTVTGTDTNTASNSHEAGVVSTTVNYVDLGAGQGGLLSFTGDAATLPLNDSILINRSVVGAEWRWVGNGVPSAGDPDEDGIVGDVSLVSGRKLFDKGAVLLFEISMDRVADLDALFSANRSAVNSGDFKFEIVVPAPAAILLGVIGLGVLGYLKHRYA